MSAHEHEVLHLRDRFSEDAADELWIPALAKEGGWIIISGDTRIARTPQLRVIWTNAKLTTFFLGKAWMKEKFWENAWRLVRWWPRIIEQAALVAPGAAFDVPWRPSGKFRQIR
jgi:hypothetical protein